jgi:glycosyltransferase involved in cell wall biosynthesis
MTRLVVATQRIDPDHPALAATIPKLRALAARVDRLSVLCDTARPGLLPDDVTVHAFGAAGRAARGARFEVALARELTRGRAPFLSHMIPLYAIFAAPLVRPLRSPLLLWYTHWNPTRELRLATRLVTHALSVDRASFPVPTRKLHAIGHGIDVSRFDLPRAGRDGLRLVALGRMSPMKRYATLLRALRLALDAGIDVHAVIRGPSLTEEERGYRQEVERLAAELDLGGRVEIGDPLPWDEVPGALAAADVLVNLAEAADKIVYEAAAARTLPVASAPAFASFLPEQLRFVRDDAASLADRLGALAATAAPARMTLGEELRTRVSAEHSVDSWADAVCRIAGVG